MRGTHILSLLLLGACTGTPEGGGTGPTLGGASDGGGEGDESGGDEGGGDEGGGDEGGDEGGGDEGGGDEGGGDEGGLTEASDPGYPEFPQTIERLTVTLRTADATYSGTNSNKLSVCLTEGDCFRLDNADFNDFEIGETNVFHFEGVDLDRALVDQVTLTSSDGSDMWRGQCLELAFDGEPVYCRDELDLKMGSDGGDEVESWTDPAGLSRSCTTCFDEALSHGPMLGTSEADTVRVWVRTHATRAVSLRATTAEQPEGVVVDWAYPLPEDDFTAVLEVPEVDPSTALSLEVALDGEVAATLQASSAPAAGEAGALRFAFGSCTKDEDQPIFDHVAAEGADRFFFVGDNHYGNTDDLGGLWSWYRWSLERPERKAYVATTPISATWDDHDFTGNNTDGTSPGRATALQAFADYWANPTVGDGVTPGVFTSFQHGEVAFYFVDDRYHRGLDDSMLGAEQAAWLTQEVLATEATFHVIVCGSQFTQDGSGDSWASFPEAHEALLGGLQDAGVGGLVLLSGDIHRSELRLDDRGSRAPIPELTSSPMATWNSSCNWDDAGLLDCYDEGESYVVVDIDTAASDATITARIVDEAGQTVGEQTWLRSELE